MAADRMRMTWFGPVIGKLGTLGIIQVVSLESDLNSARAEQSLATAALSRMAVGSPERE